MLESIVKNVSEVIFRLSISDGMNICELSKVSEIPVDIVRQILINLHKTPIWGISLGLDRMSAEDDILDLSTDFIDKEIIWKAELYSNSLVPIENLDDEEQLILKRILKEVEDKDWDDFWCNSPNNSAVFVKGTSDETDEIFKCRHYLNIRYALVEEKKIYIKYKNEQCENIECEAIPLAWYSTLKSRIGF